MVGQYWVGVVGDDFGGVVFFQGFGGVIEGVGGIDYVVYQYVGMVFDVIDDVYYFGLVGFGMMFVDDCKIYVQGFGYGVCVYYVVDVWGDDYQVFEVLVFDIVYQYGGIVDVVYWDIEEVLDLICVQVDCEDMVDFDDGQYVGYYFGVDGYVGGMWMVILVGIVEVGDDSGDMSG